MKKLTLKQWRKSKGISSVFVAKALGITRVSLENKEKGLSEFRMNEIRILLKLYGITFDQID